MLYCTNQAKCMDAPLCRQNAGFFKYQSGGVCRYHCAIKQWFSVFVVRRTAYKPSLILWIPHKSCQSARVALLVGMFAYNKLRSA